MKRDFKMWLAIVLLTVLVLYLILVSARTGRERQDEINKLENVVQSLTEQPVPKDGKDGYTPIKGVDYFDGTPGVSIKGDKGDTVVGPQGEPGQSVAGPQGEPGADGRNLELSCVDGLLKTRYTGDLLWSSTNIVCTLATPEIPTP